MSSKELSITELIPKLVDGDSTAQRYVWEHFFANLCRVAHQRLARRRVGKADEEDVALSAFESLFRRLRRGEFASVKRGDDLWRLLVKITKRKALNLLRDELRQKRGAGRVLGESVFARPDSTYGPGLDAVAIAEPTPDFLTAMKESVDRLLSRLDDEAKRIALYKMEGMTNREIATRIGRSRATVERRLKLIRETWIVLEGIEDIDDD
jgi:RNA polymerase sigma factor (sigma-70 family)